jgi:hypothetical protein
MYKRMLLPFPHTLIVIEKDNGDGTRTCFGPDNTEMYEAFLKWNAEQETPIDISPVQNQKSIQKREGIFSRFLNLFR